MGKKPITPVHPGEYLKQMLEELGLSQYRLARDIGVAAMRISHVTRGQRPVTAELALRLGRYFRQSPRFLAKLASALRHGRDRRSDRCASRSRSKAV